MKRIALWLLIPLFLTACGGTSTPPVQPVEALPATPVVDVPAPAVTTTPLPAEISAPLVQAPAIIYLDMLSETNGWAVTALEVIRTNDGGTTWHNVTPPGIGDLQSSRLTLLDVNHAWLQVPDPNNFPNAGSLYRTADGGITWTFASTPFSGGQMAFLDENNGWMMADLGTGAGSQAVAVYQTTDGGTSWTLTYTNDPNQPQSGDTLPLGGLKGMIVPLNMQTAWIGGVTYAPSVVYLYRTDDAGHTWTQAEAPLPADVNMSEIDVDAMKFVSEKDGFLALRLMGDTYRTAFYVTHDAGNSWSLMPTILPGTGTTEILSAQEIVFYNGQQFYVTRDAAQSWGIADPDVAFGDFFATMSFANASTGWVIKSDLSDHRSLYKTTDGGKTWSVLIP